MTDVKSLRRPSRNVNVPDQNALFKDAALIVAQHLRDTAEFIDETSHPGVGCAHHGPARFDTAENRVRKMLTRTRRAQKPAIVRYVGEKIGATQDKLAGEFADRVLKAD